MARLVKAEQNYVGNFTPSNIKDDLKTKVLNYIRSEVNAKAQADGLKDFEFYNELHTYEDYNDFVTQVGNIAERVEELYNAYRFDNE